MTDGTSIMRTMVESMSTANASPSPNIFTSGDSFRTNAPNTKIMIKAADVITRAVRESPRTTACRVLCEPSYSSRMRVSRNTW